MSNLRRLPVLQSPGLPSSRPPRSGGEGSLGKDGRHKRPYPADVEGRFMRARRVVYFMLIALWAALPWIPVGGHPAVFLDIEKRQFFLFGLTFNAQDVWLVFFLLSGVGFALVYATAVLGRAWCGWACPQTVFLESVFRPIERLFNGSRNEAMRRAREPLGFDRIWRAAATHLVYLVVAVVVAHILLAYFVSTPKVFAMVRANPGAHPEAFAWALVMTGVIYGNFAFFREQLCVVICPYGRLQSALLDDNSLVVGYDELRGEPRGKAKSSNTGDCVDCQRCVVVCPTGIDIREGLQLDCIACTACIDACDEVMDKLHRPRGLIRYDSLNGLRGLARQWLRPRIYVYTVLLVIGAVVASVAFHGRTPFELNLVRLNGMPYTRTEGTLRNAFEVHLVNKQGSKVSFELEPVGSPDLEFAIGIPRLELEPMASRRIPVFVSMPQGRFRSDVPFVIRVVGRDASGTVVTRESHAVFLGAPP